MFNTLSLEQKRALINYLKPFATEERQKRFEDVIAHRTKHISVVLEDIFQSHNTSAVLRSCECFGIQDVHIIENEHVFNVNPDIALGSSKWLDIHHYNSDGNNTVKCIDTLKEKGYKVIATTPHEKSVCIEDLDLTQKTALLFGTELKGLSQTALDNADSYVRIPMYGFTESLNISVTVAVSMFYLSRKLRNSSIDYKLSPEDNTNTLLLWYKNTIKSADMLIEKYLHNNK